MNDETKLKIITYSHFVITTTWITTILLIYTISKINTEFKIEYICLSILVVCFSFEILIYRTNKLLTFQLLTIKRQWNDYNNRRNFNMLYGHRRIINKNDEKLLLDIWIPKLNLSSKINHLRYLENRIRDIERTCVGRLANNSQDTLLHLLIAEVLAQEGNVSHLEIGSLFGINNIIIHDLVSCLTDAFHFTMIDPLDGYYDHENPDPGTGMPVTEKILQRNLTQSNITEDHYTIIKRYSHDPEAIRRAGERTYNFILIDGDHSYEGIKNDFTNYTPFLCPKGFIVIDDYGHPSWPGVTQYIDKEVKKNTSFELIGDFSKTIVFRKK